MLMRTVGVPSPHSPHPTSIVRETRNSTKRNLLSAPREAGDGLRVIPALICATWAASAVGITRKRAPLQVAVNFR